MRKPASSSFVKKRKAIRKTIATRLDARNRAEKRFQLYGKIALSISFIFLAALILNISYRGHSAFLQTQIQLPIDLTHLAPESSPSRYRTAIYAALKNKFPEVKTRKDIRQLYSLVSTKSHVALAKKMRHRPDDFGGIQSLWLIASSDVDMFMKGRISGEIPEENRKIKDQHIAWINALKEEGHIKKRFNRSLFTQGSSSEPEVAGILGGLIGSIFIILTCIAAAFPIGVLTAIYLEEFAPKNKLTGFIEVNINNLAAVPSIVFGLLGLSIYLQFFGLPRSSALVGGLTLSLMALPVIVISTRTSLRAVPGSLRDAAIALGASKTQTAFHHTLPAALPGIMTGLILSTARILGETAPLLMIGMVAFIVDIPKNVTEPANAMPVLVYLWSDKPEIGFSEKTSAAILMLIFILVIANSLAVHLRKKYEIKW